LRDGTTARTLEAGTTYELTIDTRLIRAVDGGALVPLIRPIIFTTQPETRLVDVRVNNQSFAAQGFPINAGSAEGTITLTFSRDIGGSYDVIGPEKRFFIIEDFRDEDLTDDLFARFDFVDQRATVTGNTLTIGYRITPQSLRNSGLRTGTQNTNVIVRFSLRNIRPFDDDENYENLNTVPKPNNIRGRVRGDLGVRGKGPLLQVTNYTPNADFGTFPRQDPNPADPVYLNDKSALNRFGPGNVGVTEFAFYFSTGGTPTGQSFPDLVISSVRNAAESVSQAAKQTVSTARGWWKRFRGE
jgi:hypothetical protein